MQIADWLGLPELYTTLPALISVRNIESGEMASKANDLAALLDQWAKDPAD
jgi:hypothetical protein